MDKLECFVGIDLGDGHSTGLRDRRRRLGA